MMTIRQIAKAFDMKVKDFADYIGYSRQSLYDEPTPHSTVRTRATVQLLSYQNQQMLDKEIQEAKARFEKRIEAIEALERILVKDGDA